MFQLLPMKNVVSTTTTRSLDKTFRAGDRYLKGRIQSSHPRSRSNDRSLDISGRSPD
jgi:hypothetical protein